MTESPPDPSEHLRSPRAAKKELELQSSVLSAPSEAPLGETVGLIGRARAGDRDAANELALRYQDRLHAYVRVKMRGRNLGKEAEDVVNDAYYQLFKRLEEFEYRGKDSVYAYLVRIASNMINTPAGRAAVAGGGDETEAYLLQVLGREPTPSEQRSQLDLREILEATLLELPEEQRQALLYRHVLGVPSKLAAQWMGLDDHAQFDHLVNRAKMKWLKIAEPRLEDWRASD